jgi:hypothetical protein
MAEGACAMDPSIWNPIIGLLSGPVTLFTGLSCPQHLPGQQFEMRSGVHALLLRCVDVVCIISET